MRFDVLSNGISQYKYQRPREDEQLPASLDGRAKL